MLQRFLWLLFNFSYLIKKFFLTSKVYGRQFELQWALFNICLNPLVGAPFIYISEN